MDKLLGETNDQLSNQGLYIKSGGISIVDASVIEAKQWRPNKQKTAYLHKFLKRNGMWRQARRSA